MSDKKKMIYEINGDDLIDKGFERFISSVKEAKSKDPELANFPMPESMVDMLEATYRTGFQDGCVYIAEYISDIMEGQGKVTINKN